MEKKEDSKFYEFSFLVTHSRGLSKNFNRVAYVTPGPFCDNKPIRVTYFTDEELQLKIKKLWAKKWFPFNLYKIAGKKYIAKNDQQALKEHWRICERSEIGKMIPIEFIQCDARQVPKPDIIDSNVITP